MARELFGRYVEQTKPSWRRRALIMASLALHGGAAFGILVYSVFHVEEIAPPVLSLTFFSAPPPPPPPPPPAKKKSSSSEVKTQPVEHKMVQPTDTPKIIQPIEKKQEDKKDEPEEDGAMEGGEEGGVKGGEVGGVMGGTLGGVKGGQIGGTGTDLNAKPGPVPKTVAGFTLIAQQLSHPNPHLPAAVMESRPHQDIRGMYKVCIRNDGHISDVTPMTAIPGADGTIAEQIRSTWVYKPQPVPVCFVAALTFKVP
jgi:protein TonB